MDKRGLSRKLRVFLTLVACVVFILSAYSLTLVISNLTGYSLFQNSIQEFGKCLIEKDVIFYADSDCLQCDEQKKIFERFNLNIDFVNCDTDKYACYRDNIDFVPSFKFKGKLYNGIFSLKEITDITGC